MSQTNAQLLADSLGTASTGTVPIGGIILWSGTVEQINNLPGWALCNGVNGTPDLRNRFVVGAYNDNQDDIYPNLKTRQTGGSADAVVVEHNHTLTGGAASGTFVSSVTTLREGRKSGATYAVDSLTTETASVSYTQPTAKDKGEVGTNKNLPPYYSLAYIMRTS